MINQGMFRMFIINFFLIVFVLMPFANGDAMADNDNISFKVSNLMSDYIVFQYAIYVLPTSSDNQSEILDNLLKTKYDSLTRVDDIEETKPGMTVIAYNIDVNKGEFEPSYIQFLSSYGEGLSKANIEELHDIRKVFVMVFAHGKEYVFDGLRNANNLMYEIAKETDSLVWDSEIRKLYSAEAWHKETVFSMTDMFPDASKHTVIHAYQQDDFLRSITLGMLKFGLPDVVVEDHSKRSANHIGTLINIFIQAMVEGASFNVPGEYDLSIKNLKNVDLSTLPDNGTGFANLTLKMGQHEEGDPEGRLIEITFDKYDGPDHYSRTTAMLEHFFGSDDSLSYIDHTKELMNVSKKAKEQLPALRELFQAGVRPSEYIMLKAPFETPDGGNEWMWVEVVKWNNDSIDGTLTNEPYNIPSLKSGQMVNINMEDVFDYMHVLPDGTVLGNETAEIIMKMQEE